MKTSLKTVFVFLCLFQLVIFPLMGQDFTIIYLEGYPELKDLQGWSELGDGDELDKDQVVRLADGDYLELELAGNIVKLMTPGKYSLEAIYRSRVSAEITRKGRGVQLLNHYVLGKNELYDDTVAGVRGDIQEAVSDDDLLNFLDDLDSEDLEQGLVYFEEGNYEKALEFFNTGMEWEASNYNELLFYSALCHYNLNDLRAVQKEISVVELDEDDPIYIEMTFFRINWAIENFQYSEALDILNKLSPILSKSNDKQLSSFLYGYCYYSINDYKRAGEYLDKTVDGSSEDIRLQAENLKSLL